MANIQVIERRTALRSQRETRAGDVHVCITDRESTNPHRAWWITEQALNHALTEMTLDELDQLVRRSPAVRRTSVEYPVRDYYFPLYRDNAARAACGQRGANDVFLWRWRSFPPTGPSLVSSICRWDDAAGCWIEARTGNVVWRE